MEREAQPIPALNNAQMKLNFGRMDSDYTIVDHSIPITNQDTLSGAVFNQMRYISNIELNMTEEQFRQVWKTLILKRVQDVFTTSKGTEPANLLEMDNTTIVPAPLADLLSALGTFTSDVTGHHHHIIPVARPAKDTPAFWGYDDELLHQWSILCGRMQHLYSMKVFPEDNDVDKRPLTLTMVHTPIRVEGQVGPLLRRIKAYTDEPTANDALIRAVNDNLFTEEGEWTANLSHLIMTPLFNVNQVVDTYVSSYVLGNNA